MPPETVSKYAVRVGFRTDRGLVRPLNEDSLLVDDGIFAVCDGMGGHEAGEVASLMCARILGAGYRDEPDGVSSQKLAEILDTADSEIRTAIGGRGGTTVTGLALIDDGAEGDGIQWCVFNVGDSRTYVMSEGKPLTQITRDHSQVQELVEMGQLTQEQADVHPRRHVITRALGTGDTTEADMWLRPVTGGERYLVCSDGLSGEVHGETINEVLSVIPDPQTAADRLIQLAIESGGRDNVSVIVLDVESTSNPE